MSTLLVADDDPQILEALSTFGRKRGFEVRTAGRGDTALEMALSEPPDLMLLDVMMPGLDGRDVMKRLHESGLAQRIIVIFVTARDAQSDRLVGLQLGAVDYETKPLHFGRLFDKLERLLAKRKSGEL